jgi:hypothetical protein
LKQAEIAELGDDEVRTSAVGAPNPYLDSQSSGISATSGNSCKRCNSL